MFGVLFNTATVLVGSAIGLALNRGIPEKLSATLMQALALCTVYIGIDGALAGENTLILILSLAIGTIIGEGLDLDEKLNRFAKGLESRFRKQDGKVSIAEGFITASLLFCVGAMTIVGSLQAGLTGNQEMLITKALLDFVSSIVFASALGIGVMFAAGFVLVLQGGIVLLAQLVQPFFTDAVIAEMNCAGSVLIIALGLNILGVTKLKVLNFLPGIFLPILLCPLLAKIPFFS